jgi:hypothetical protein
MSFHGVSRAVVGADRRRTHSSLCSGARSGPQTMSTAHAGAACPAPSARASACTPENRDGMGSERRRRRRKGVGDSSRKQKNSKIQ